MTESNLKTNIELEDQMDLRMLILKISDWIQFLRKKWLIIIGFGFLGALIGVGYAFTKSYTYTATLSFAMDDEKAGNMLTGAVGLASSLGIDLGTSAGGAFSGGNLIELLKSRRMIEKALLNSVSIDGKNQTLANYYMNICGVADRLQNNPVLKDIKYEVGVDRAKFTFRQDSVMGILIDSRFGFFSGLSVYQRDKKVSIINVEMSSGDEIFAKLFVENLAKEVSVFYVEAKSRKARLNVGILQKQVDSVRNELNEAITGVATANDNVYNLNSAMNLKRTPSTKRQVDVSANTAILTTLVTNLEMAKVTLLKETPLIQIIDVPVLPLKKEKASKLNMLIFGGILATFLTIIGLIVMRIYNEAMSVKPV